MQHRRLNTDGKTLESHRNEEHTTGVGPAASRCLSEDEVMRLCAGEIAEEHLGRIDEHLDRCEACQRWVAEVMAHGATNPAPDDASTYPTAFRAGTMAAGRFRIVRFIKRGGMGEVYEAFDSVLETRVALKTIISTACDSPRAVRKLKAEVQLARSIRHPNVCSVFDIWEHHPAQGDGSSVYFFTMEFIDGQSLRQLLERSLFELGETLRIARLELLGLRAAHDAGVVHRDFKSDNVMLRNDRRDDGQVVVMDFGLARTLAKEGASNDSEQFAGSVAYMAPEQVEGKRHIGAEADVFAFGVVLFEMLTGELPWVGDSPWTTAALRLTQRAPAPSRFRPGLSPRLDAFVLKCLSREPDARFRDAREALAAFDELLEPPPERSRAWVAAALAGALLAGAGVAVTVQQRLASSVESLHPEPPPAAAPPPTSPASPASPPVAAPNLGALTSAAPPPPAAEAPPAPAPLPTPANDAPAERAAGPEPQPGSAPNRTTSPEGRGDAPEPDSARPSEPAERTAPSARTREAEPNPAPPRAHDAIPSAPTPAPAASHTPAAAHAPAEPRSPREGPVDEVRPRRPERAPGAPAKLHDFE